MSSMPQLNSAMRVVAVRSASVGAGASAKMNRAAGQAVFNESDDVIVVVEKLSNLTKGQRIAIAGSLAGGGGALGVGADELYEAIVEQSTLDQRYAKVNEDFKQMSGVREEAKKQSGNTSQEVSSDDTFLAANEIMRKAESAFGGSGRLELLVSYINIPEAMRAKVRAKRKEFSSL